jgi:hypothetical protein
MNDNLSHVTIRTKEEVDQWLATEKTKFTLNQIHTLTRIAAMVEVSPTKYKTTAIFHLRMVLRVLFDDGDTYCYNLLSMSDPEEALKKLKVDLEAALSKKGLKLDNRSLNTVYLSGSHKETSVPLPEPFSGPRSLQNRKNKMSDADTKDAVATAAKATTDYTRALAKNGVSFSARATHPGYKLYAIKPNVRAAGAEGYPGMAAIVAEQGILFEEWAKKDLGLNHLNWDINRGAVVTVPKDEEFDLAAALAAAPIKAARKPNAPKAETAAGEAPAEEAPVEEAAPETEDEGTGFEEEEEEVEE